MSGLSEPIIGQPLFGIFITLASYAAAELVWRRLGRPAILNPVLTATAAIAAGLVLVGVPYATYLSQARLINEALSLVIVLLAVPLCRQYALISSTGFPIGFALAAGATVAFMSALALPVAAGADQMLLATLAAKSATTAVAVQIAEQFGGIPGLTAIIVIMTGIFGAVAGLALLEASGVQDERAKGFALGVASHGVGTALAFQISETAGTFASLGMILNSLLTIAAVPMIMAAL